MLWKLFLFYFKRVAWISIKRISFINSCLKIYMLACLKVALQGRNWTFSPSVWQPDDGCTGFLLTPLSHFLNYCWDHRVGPAYNIFFSFFLLHRSFITTHGGENETQSHVNPFALLLKAEVNAVKLNTQSWVNLCTEELLERGWLHANEKEPLQSPGFLNGDFSQVWHKGRHL